MAIPHKKSRLIEVSSVEYRWYVRHRPSHRQGVAESNLSFAVEHAQTPGMVLVVETPYKHPSNWLGETAIVVLPADVARHIEAALAQGWQPTQNGKPFHMGALKMQNESELVTPPALIL